MIDADFKDLVVREIQCNSAFRTEVRLDLLSIKTRFAAEDAIKAYRSERTKTLFKILGTVVAIAGLAVPFFLQ